MKRRRSPRLARLGALGLLAGAVAGAAAGGDIEKSYRKGRVAPAAFASATARSEPSTPPAADAFGLAASHGYTMAASLRFTRREECRTVAPEMRSGCLDYVARRASGALEPEGDDLI